MVGAAVLARPIAPSHVAHEKYVGCFGAWKTFEKETVHFYHETDLLQGVHVFFKQNVCRLRGGLTELDILWNPDGTGNDGTLRYR